MNIIIQTLLLFLMGSKSYAQNLNNVQYPHMQKVLAHKEIKLPNILGYKTLKCDFHMHTVFSDGIVWPTYRVIEAWEEGLDAIAITDHIEKQPSKKYVSGDHNASYEIAKQLAIEKNILLVHSGEVTRSMPPGHLNALFLSDVNLLDLPDRIGHQLVEIDILRGCRIKAVAIADTGAQQALIAIHPIFGDLRDVDASARQAGAISDAGDRRPHLSDSAP